MEKQETETETVNIQAIEALKALSHYEYPMEVSQIQTWLSTTKQLQNFIKTSCEKDRSRKMALDCVNVLYDLIATNGELVSPATWDILEVVGETEVEYLCESFLKDSTMRLKNALCALVNGVCQCGHRISEIQTLCYTFIKGLEDNKKYSVLLSISQMAMFKLLNGLVLPHCRKFVYHLLERILYPMIYPHLFNTIIDYVPEVLCAMRNKQDEEMMQITESFCGLIKTLMDRFPPTSRNDESYKRIKTELMKFPESTYKPPINFPVWKPKHKHVAKIWNLLECPVCYERFLTPIIICENGHCICRKCKSKVKSCPLCRAQFSNIRLTIMDQIMEVTEFRCRNFDLGCDVEMMYNDIWEHENECEYRTVSCDIVSSNSLPKFLCNEDVIASHFHKHMEELHKLSITNFELSSELRGELRFQETNEVKLLKNAASNLYFIERIFVSSEEIFFSYHYQGKKTDANKYIYTIKINGVGIPKKMKYSNFCLPNYMGIVDTEGDKRCFILDPAKIFDSEQTKFEYSVKIEDVITYRLRLKKNKCLGSI